MLSPDFCVQKHKADVFPFSACTKVTEMAVEIGNIEPDTLTYSIYTKCLHPPWFLTKSFNDTFNNTQDKMVKNPSCHSPR